MKGLKILLILFLPIGGLCQSWDLTISSTEDEILVDAIENSFGNYVLCGNTGTYNFLCDGWIVEIDPSGNMVDSVRFSNAYNYLFFSKIIEVAGGYMTFGTTRVDSTSDRQLFVKKLDYSFNELWTKIYGSDSYDVEWFHNVIIDNNNNFVASGTADSAITDPDFFVYIFDSNGDSLTSAYYSYPGTQFGFDILELPTNDGYKVFTFGVPSGNSSGSDEVVTIDANLNITNVFDLDTIFPNPIANSQFYFNLSAKWLNDSVYLAAAKLKNVEYFGQNGPDWMDIGLLFLDANDSLKNAVAFGKSDTTEYEPLHSVDFVYQSDIYVGGSSNFTATLWGTNDTWYNLNKVDSAGNVQWEKWYGGDTYYYLWKVLATQDSGCLMVGTKYDWQTANGNERDVWIVKIGPDGEYLPGIEKTVLPETAYKVFPNPASRQFTIQGSFALPATIELYDISGRQVHRQAVSSNRQQINVGKFANGLYIYRLVSDGKVARGKIVLE